MKGFKKILFSLFTMIFIGIITFFSALIVLRLGYSVVDMFVGIDDKVTSAIITAVSVVLSGMFIAIYTQRETKKREIDEAHRADKVKIYKDFLDTIKRTFNATNSNIQTNVMPPEEIANFHADFVTNMILWSDPKVIIAFKAFQKAGLEYNKNPDTNDKELFGKLDSLFHAIRQDIGLSNNDLPSLYLVNSFENFTQNPIK